MKRVALPFITAFSIFAVLQINFVWGQNIKTTQVYEQDETRKLILLVNDAAELLRNKGEVAFDDFRMPNTRWRKWDKYIFVLDPEGVMVLHPDPALEGKNIINLKDINGKPIVRGLLAAATTFPNKPEGWYHYQWPVPGELLPRWKSSFVRLVNAPSGKSYIVGSGMYNDRMEREFVVDMVKDAVAQIEKNQEEAFKFFHDPSGPFMVKDAYVFLFDLNGTDLVNPGFPYLEGRNMMDQKDTHGKFLVREMINTVNEKNSGWVDYMWPKPGQSVSTVKSAFVSKAKLGDKWVLVGCGVYLPEASKSIPKYNEMAAPELLALVRIAAKVFEQRGEKAYPEFRNKGGKWFHNNTYFFVWTMDAVRVFHAADSASEGINAGELKDVNGRPIGSMILKAGSTPSGEGWIHYMYPEPGNIFPTWKSTFVKRVLFPSGKQYIIGCGIYSMQIHKVFIEDVVNSAAKLIADRGKEAFAQLRDKTGPFVFMNTYIFVQSPDGTELVNPAQPSLEGKNLIDLRDLKGKLVIRDQIAAAMTTGSVWLECYWYKPGDNIPALKQTYIRKVNYKDETYLVGSGLYVAETPAVVKQKPVINKKQGKAVNKKRQ
ncbi:MAG: cache domain-containing protein [Bacteroidota bacterium]|nr:cache domain-containing protein [Bacteroidota bacterium]